MSHAHLGVGLESTTSQPCNRVALLYTHGGAAKLIHDSTKLTTTNTGVLITALIRKNERFPVLHQGKHARKHDSLDRILK